ncbi:multiprotein-bridging factor 1 family protein [Streptomyces nigra]|uniref:multiprotein-bridging factor 1 family protein n=1 Tax=Streptomyces nigra TaxID=1827580 RepID=UPI0037D682F3
MKWSPEDWARLGAQIRKAREAQGLSRRKLAEISGVSEKSIQLTEEGRVPTRWPKSLKALEAMLGWANGDVEAVLDGGELNPLNPTDVIRAGQFGGYTRHEYFDLARHDLAKAAPTYPGYGAPSSRDVELVHSGHLAQDVFMRQAARYRKLRGVSVKELARKLAGQEPILDEDDLKRLENGTRLLRMAEASAIAAALETTVDWLLGSGFSPDAPEEMRWPPNDKELEAEANAVMRRMGDVGGQLVAARQQARAAHEREVQARQEAQMAMAMVQSIEAQQAEMHSHYQYILGRIDSIRAARGEETAIQIVPVFEEDGE